MYIYVRTARRNVATSRRCFSGTMLQRRARCNVAELFSGTTSQRRSVAALLFVSHVYHVLHIATVQCCTSQHCNVATF